MTNIGPFVDRTTVDLSRIDEDGLFLISGPTGSGKSFIFDTICYALYGRTPSGREGHLSSDHAGLGDVPRIRFSFRLKSSEYLIERTLEYEDHVKKGEGTTTRNEKASLVMRTDEGRREECLATKKTDVNNKCAEILGLDMEQFSRVMMIPQGEFRELLRAETKDREKLLRRLFDSSLFFDISDELSRRYGKLSDELKEGRSRNETRIETIVNKLELDRGPGDGSTFDEWSRTTLERSMEEISKLNVEEKKADKEWKRIRKHLEICKEAYSTERALRTASEKLRELKKRETDEIQPLKNRLELSGRAGYLREELGRLDEIIKARDRSVRELGQKEKVLKEKRSEMESIRKEYDEMAPGKKEELDSIKECIGSLDRGRPKVEEMDRIRSTMRPLEKEVEKKHEEMKTISERRKRIGDELKELIRQVKGLPVLENIVEITMARKAGEDLISILEREESIREKVRHLDSEVSKKKEMVKERELDLKKVRKGREDSMAGELASSLEKGVECPVCGSLRHPRPREPTSEDISQEMVAEAERSLERAEGELSRSEKELTRLGTKMDELGSRTREIIHENRELELPLRDLRIKVEELRTKEKDIGSTEKRRQELEERIEGLEKEERNLREEEIRTNGYLNKKGMTLEGLKTRFDERAAVLEELSLDTDDPLGSLEERSKKLKKRQNELSEWITRMEGEMVKIKEVNAKAEQDHSSCLERLKTSKERAESTKKGILRKIEEMEGIDTIKDLRNAIMTEGEERRLRDIIQRFREELSGLKRSVADHGEKLESFEIEVPDRESLERVQEDERRRSEEWKRVHGELVNLERDLQWVKRELKSINDSRKEMEAKEEEISVVGKLAMQVKGNAVPRISLERFFLAQRFEEVLIASNHRLKVLSGGRFLLRRSGIRGKRSKGGLDIDVYDNHTGQERPAHTLSGGQMFLSSLALALGLADVVQSRSGGIRMDALFIDEGFGSLDDETLQTALKVLSELRKGRMVGVISHVGELKRQIKSGFEVVPSATGSHLRSLQG
ncbi:MAG: SbcC/MukB-like Walker B domain-containing protein [Thermoplasmatota archaeon]